MSTETKPPSPYELKDVITQTDETASMVPTDGAIRNYVEELAIQMVIVDKVKERYEMARAKADKIKEQVEKREIELQQLLHDQTAQL